MTERQEQIVRTLEAKGHATAIEIACNLGTSPAAISDDIRWLHREDKIRRLCRSQGRTVWAPPRVPNREETTVV